MRKSHGVLSSVPLYWSLVDGATQFGTLVPGVKGPGPKEALIRPHVRNCVVNCIEGEGEGEVAFFSVKRWDRRNRADRIESATPCHDALVVGPYWESNPLRLTVLAAMSEDYTTAPQHLQKKV